MEAKTSIVAEKQENIFKSTTRRVVDIFLLCSSEGEVSQGSFLTPVTGVCALIWLLLNLK